MSYFTNSFDDKVVSQLNNGGIGLIPTDTIYGLSCRALERTAVEKIHRLKGRDYGKPFIVLIANLKMLDLLSIKKDQTMVAKKYWPGALSLILHSPQAPTWLHLNTSTLAVRIPDTPPLLGLIKQVGPLISTSANLSGQAPAESVSDVQAIFGNKLDFYVDNGELAGLPSTLTIVKDGQLQILRQGAVIIHKKEF